jgi:hypothetical protein
MATQSIRDAAKNGDAAAISTILNTNLNPQWVQVEVGWQEGCLQIRLQAHTVPSQNSVDMIHSWLESLESPSILKVQVYGLRVDSDRPDWCDEFELIPSQKLAETLVVPPAVEPLSLQPIKPKYEPSSVPPEGNRGHFSWGVILLAAGLGLGLMVLAVVLAVPAYFLLGRNNPFGVLAGLLILIALYAVAPATLILSIVTMFWTPGRQRQPVRRKQLQSKQAGSSRLATVTAQPLAMPSRNLYIHQAVKYGILIFTAGLSIDALLCFMHNIALNTHDYTNDNLAFKIPPHRTGPTVKEFLQPFLIGGCSRGNAILLQPFLFIVSLAHAIKNTAVNPAIRVAFGIGCLLIPPICIPIYCHLFIWRDRPPTWSQNSRNS